ncbi:MAG: Serine/threonine-protein kinase PrkC [Planctomycetota bacterium]|jgi:WD40 repeat protein
MSSDPATPTPDQQRSAEELFDVVRLLPPAERDAAILSRTADPWVRAEVRSLLRFDEPTVETLGSPRDDHFDAAKCVGLSVGGFTLRSVIGVGGMGTVFEAEQELPARRIAVKVLHSATARASTLARFRKESEFLARLDHPNIARVIAAGTLHLPGDVTARPYFAMELVDGGRSLSRWAREERVGRSNIIRTFVTACEAVGSGHRAGIVHLDLKPGNLLVSRSGALRVIDYGIARSLDATEEPSESSFAGTPQYMSPEQLTRGARVDSRADVYALGLILYELLAGRFPYETRGESMASVVRIVRESRPTDVRLVDATVPADLAAIVDKALAKEPDDRYGTASELADDLKRWLADEPVLAAPQSLGRMLTGAMRRNRIATGMAAIAVIAVMAGTLASIALGIAAREAASRAERHAARANVRAAAASIAGQQPADAMVLLPRVAAEFRGWEARHIDACVANIDLYSQTGREILTVQFHAPSREVLAGITGGQVQVIDPTGQRPTEEYDIVKDSGQPMPSISIMSLSATADGTRVFVNMTDGAVFEIDRTARRLHRLPEMGAARLHAVGDTLVVVGLAGDIAFVDLATRTIVGRLTGLGGAIDASFSQDGSVVLVAFADGRLRCIDADPKTRTARERWLTAARIGGTRAAAVSPAGDTMLVTWDDGRVARIDSTTGATLMERDLPGGSVYDLAISPEGRLAAASSWTNMVRIVDTDSLEIVDRLGGTFTHVWNISFDDIGSRLFGSIVLAPTNAPGPIRSIDCVGAWILDDNRAIADQQLARSLTAARHGPRPAQFTAADGEGTLHEFDARSGVWRELARIGGRVTRIARSEDHVAVALDDGSLIILKDESGNGGSSTLTELHRLQGAMRAPVPCLDFSPDGALLAVGSIGTSTAMLDVAKGELLWRFDLPGGHGAPNRRSVRRALFLDGGTRVTFITSLVGVTRVDFAPRTGAVIPTPGRPVVYECEDAVVHPADGTIYQFGITGSVMEDRGMTVTMLQSLARSGGVCTMDRRGERMFAATRDGAVRVAGFDPLEDLMRLDLPSGRPLAVGFDDDRDELTVVTSRGTARTWRGGGLHLTPPATSTVIVPLGMVRRSAITAPTQR